MAHPLHRRLSLVAGAVLAAVLSPGAAAACAACYQGSGGTRWAYYLTTAVLLSVPVLVGAVLFRWARRAAREETECQPR